MNTPTPKPTATPAPPAISPASVDLMGAGATQSVTINEPGYNGSITIDGTKCDGIAAASVSTVQGPSATFTVTAAAQGGTCLITLSNSLGQTLSVPVSVTITQGVIN